MWNAAKKIFANTYLHPRHLSHREIEKFVRTEAPRLEGRLLDVGCGKKPYARWMNRVDSHLGLDMPSTMHGLEQTDVLGSVMALPFSASTFDSILCTEVLEHTPDPLASLREMARIAKPRALLILTVPASEQLHEKPHDYCRFTRYWLEYLLKETGWEIVRLDPRGGASLELGYRLSIFLYSSFGATADAHGKLTPRPIASFLIVPLCACIQIFSVLVEKVWPSTVSTMGYSVLARRNQSRGTTFVPHEANQGHAEYETA
jgi:SAM-dependent methyltransferase